MPKISHRRVIESMGRAETLSEAINTLACHLCLAMDPVDATGEIFFIRKPKAGGMDPELHAAFTDLFSFCSKGSERTDAVTKAFDRAGARLIRVWPSSYCGPDGLVKMWTFKWTAARSSLTSAWKLYGPQTL